MRKDQIESVLENCKFFKGISKDIIEKISGICEFAAYKAGDFLFEQGDFGENLYIIVHGHVLLERSMDVGAKRGNVVIDALGKGRTLGCWSTLLGEAHVLMSSANCQKETQVVVLKGSQLRQMMSGDKEIGFCVLERLCFLLRDRIQAAYGAMDKI